MNIWGLTDLRRQNLTLNAYLESQKNYKKNKFELTPRLRDKINAKLGFYFEHYGYEMQK